MKKIQRKCGGLCGPAAHLLVERRALKQLRCVGKVLYSIILYFEISRIVDGKKKKKPSVNRNLRNHGV